METRALMALRNIAKVIGNQKALTDLDVDKLRKEILWGIGEDPLSHASSVPQLKKGLDVV